MDYKEFIGKIKGIGPKILEKIYSAGYILLKRKNKDNENNLWIPLVISLLFLLALIASFILGQSYSALIVTVILAFFVFVIFFIKYFFTNRSNDIIAAFTAIMAMMAILQYLTAVPLFYYDGKEACGSGYTILINEEKQTYSVHLNDLAARLQGEGTRSIWSKTAIFTDENFSCWGCEPLRYIKPDGSGSMDQNIDFTIEKEKNENKFVFAQQVKQGDGLFTNLTQEIRVCECTPDFDANKLNCEKKDDFELDWFGTEFFKASKDLSNSE
ncbi:MAG: hypothetical protein JW703_00745 [Candidatus Diapherotrites archaeon]|nr:hypothetical protein [Candidatus Diapherotrites archaeon]